MVTSPEQVLLGYLQQHAELELSYDRAGTGSWVHRTVYSLLLGHGQWHVPAPLPGHVDPLPERACFVNAQRTELVCPSLTYAEGWAIAGAETVPAQHAWCVTDEGVVVDPTWVRFGGRRVYFGIVLADPLLRPGADGDGVPAHPSTLFPVLRDGLRLEAPAGSAAAGGRGRSVRRAF